MTKLELRSARTTDKAYVTNSWVSALCGNRSVWGEAGVRVNDQVDAMLDDARTRLTIACTLEDSDRIVGWCATASIPGARVIEFVHVRRQRRKEGIARLLLHRAEMLGRGSPVAALYQTDEWDAFAKRAFPNGVVAMSPTEFLC